MNQDLEMLSVRAHQSLLRGRHGKGRENVVEGMERRAP
jgi:hypothetical protein